MMQKYKSMWDGRLENITVAKQRTVLNYSNAPPINSALHCAGPKHQEIEREKVARMKKAAVSEHAATKAASAIVFLPKIDGRSCSSIVYRQLNAVTVRDSYPIPRMDESTAFFGKSRIFLTLDASSEYWQENMDKTYVNKRAFVTHNMVQKYAKTSFGLRNAPETCQTAKDVILATVRRHCAFVYIDDITIFLKTPKKPLRHIKEAFKLRNNAGMTINLKKCSFLSNPVDYPSHIIAPGEIHVATKTAKAIKALQHPTTVLELWSFLGLFIQCLPAFRSSICQIGHTSKQKAEKRGASAI